GLVMRACNETVRDLCNTMFDLERKYDLLNFEIEGVKVWQYMRVPIYYYLAERIGIFQAPHVRKTSGLSRFWDSFKYFVHAVVNNPLLHRHQVDEIVIEHPRTVSFAGDQLDIYSSFYVRELQHHNI